MSRTLPCTLTVLISKKHLTVRIEIHFNEASASLWGERKDCQHHPICILGVDVQSHSYRVPTEAFNLIAGVEQGCLLSPFLFSLVIVGLWEQPRHIFVASRRPRFCRWPGTSIPYASANAGEDQQCKRFFCPNWKKVKTFISSCLRRQFLYIILSSKNTILLIAVVSCLLDLLVMHITEIKNNVLLSVR